MQRKAVALISGGLDSMLAAKIIQDQGVHVEGLNFYTGFCHSGHTSSIRMNNGQRKIKRNDALWVAETLNMPLHIIDVVEEYKQTVINPKHGYGQHLNPCLDCKIFMMQKAKAWMQEHQFDFIITGEVIGQRPKSQLKKSMSIVVKDAGVNDRLLRPLCAKNLEPTLPEREGWVNRELLLDIVGRSRHRQLALAKQYNFTDYSQPAGGCCVLTDKHYTQKLTDLWRSRGNKQYELDDIILLKVGRHIRPAKHYKLIIGREEGENNFLEGYRKQFINLRVTDRLGSLVLIDGEPQEEDIHFAARIAARYSKQRHDNKVDVKVCLGKDEMQTLSIEPLDEHAIKESWYL